MISVSLEGSHRDPRPRPASPPRSRVASLPSGRRIVSASLEGSEPTLERGESSLSRSRPPLDEKDKRPFCSPARRTEALNANHSSTAPRSDGVRPPFPTVAVTGVPSANSGHCSAIPDAVAVLWEPATRDETCSAQFPSLFRQLLLTGLHLTTPMAPDPPPAWEGVQRCHVPPRRGTLGASSRRPGPPPSRGPGSPCDSRTSLVHTPALRPGGSGTAACPATAGARIYARLWPTGPTECHHATFGRLYSL